MRVILRMCHVAIRSASLLRAYVYIFDADA